MNTDKDFTPIHSDAALDAAIKLLSNPDNETYFDSPEYRECEASQREYWYTLAYIRSF